MCGSRTFGAKEAWHICVDSDVINKITVKYHFFIPRLDDMLNMSGATILSEIHFKSGYHQIRIRPGTSEKSHLKLKLRSNIWTI